EGDRLAFSQACTYPDGTRVYCLAVLDLKDGKITNQTGVQPGMNRSLKVPLPLVQPLGSLRTRSVCWSFQADFGMGCRAPIPARSMPLPPPDEGAYWGN